MRAVTPGQSKIRVTLDVGSAVHQGAGLAKYAERLAATLLAEQSEHLDITLFYNAHSGHQPPATLQQAPQRTIALGQYAWRLSVLASQLLRLPYLPLARESDGPSTASHLFHATEHLLPRLAQPTILTVHDLIFERYPAHHTRLNMLFLRTAMPLFVRSASAIIAVSEHTKRDLIELYQTPAAKIHVIHEGIDEQFHPAPADKVQRVRSQYSPGRPYLLMVGTLEPRKNHAAALRVLAQLKQAGFPHRLLVVGGKGWLFEPIRQQIAALGLENDVTFAGYVPLADLPALYGGAACLLLPSLYEGFGFPVLEAMACGAPVVCSNTSSLPEVAGEAALLVDPLNDGAIFAAVQRILSNSLLCEGLCKIGITQAARFTWSECARKTAQLYATLC